ncbi:MAG: SDR family oxidoreductase [Gammaproteobacteria bacterium]|nr:SDR family NAD(P)-dependent oxidoreductase [Gammaproteobacteria bacterium]MYH13857.1 SDR family oxidoreductase [Gammaproteobacteria bacterium]MYK82613.1 SDR family oxidoreductase [Gammaproteobacteria bacterium]
MSTGLDSIALVTGGAGAIGAAVCHALAERGERVAVADIDQENSQAIAKGLPGSGHLALGFDVANTDQVKQVVTDIQSEAIIGTLINVAGWDRLKPFVETTPEFWEKVIAINYQGTLNTVHAVLPSMIANQHGRIVSVASDAARVGSSLEAVYSGAKGAVIAFSKSVAREVARYGVTLNVVCPGPTDTPMIRGMADEFGKGGSFVDALTKATPMRRLATVEDVAPAIAFLASDGAGFITGQTLSVSGGITMC